MNDMRRLITVAPHGGRDDATLLSGGETISDEELAASGLRMAIQVRPEWPRITTFIQLEALPPGSIIDSPMAAATLGTDCHHVKLQDGTWAKLSNPNHGYAVIFLDGRIKDCVLVQYGPTTI